MVQDNDGFVAVGRSNRAMSRARDQYVPSLRVSSANIIFPQEIWVELKRPTHVVVEVNPDKKLIRMCSVPLFTGRRKEGQPRGFVVQPNQYPDGTWYYRVRLSTAKGAKVLTSNLPIGYYTSIGGGVYKYHGATVPLK